MEKLMNFDIEFKKRVAEIDNILKEYLPKEEGFIKNLWKP